LNVGFNVTFDYPFPAGDNETNVTAEIWKGSELVQSRTIPLNAYLERYGITKNGRYVFKPVYFNFSAEVKGKNISSTPISLGYTVQQYRRKPYPDEGDKSWSISGRYVYDAGGGNLDNYCSGPWDFEEGGPAYNCNDGPINIQRTANTVGKTQSYQSSGPVLYFKSGDNDKIPSTPGGGASSDTWHSSHSWKLETFVYPTIDYNGQFKIYADNGVRVNIIDMTDNSMQVKTCPSANPTLSITPCNMPFSFHKSRWYQIDVYLFNNPGGDLTTNPAGVRIEDTQSPERSLFSIIGGEGAVINSESPGADDVQIPGSETIYAGASVGLSSIRDFTMFSTDHALVKCDNQNVDCSLRMACGSSKYTDIDTDNYGWILNYPIHPENWAKVGGVSTRREGSITNKAGKKIDFDWTSIGGSASEPENIAGRSQYTENEFGAGNDRPIGGIYRCKKSDDWPFWTDECTDPGHRYNYTAGGQNYRCCYMKAEINSAFDYYGYVERDEENNPKCKEAFEQKTGICFIKDFTVEMDYNSYYTYIINFLPPYSPGDKNIGDKLCAIPKVGVYSNYQIKTLYQSSYTNQPCNESTGSKCCSCRPGWGCRTDCVNEAGASASDRFTLPFPAKSGKLWSLEGVSLGLAGTNPQVVLTSEGNVNDGWSIKANLSDSAVLTLDKNYTIPLNLFSDFGLRLPEGSELPAAYTLMLKVNYKNAPFPIQSPSYALHAADCSREGDKRSFYNEILSPGTKGTGVCRPGLQVCKKAGDNDLRWRYESKNDMPVYPASETCNGKDDDCNGITDDVNGFDWVMSQIVNSGGKLTPYQVIQCGCFMGAPPKDERCNGIDDDCNGVVDDSEAKVWANSCDSAVMACMDSGSPYEWCKKLYNSTSCSLAQVTIGETRNVTVNTCTEKAKACMGNRHINYAGVYLDVLTLGDSFTYDECKAVYNNYSCLLEERDVTALNDTCACSNTAIRAGQMPEACNGKDDDCDGVIDDIENASSTCGCAMLTNVTLIHQMKAGNDVSCNGIDSNCNGIIDDGVRNCACTGRPPKDALNVKANAKETCNGVDDDCNGLVDEKFPQIGKPCGYGVCTGGAYVCNAHGDEAVCNTTVNPDETFNGEALKLSSPEICDLMDNDCDGAIDEGCSCTPENAVKLCGYESSIYYKNRGQLEGVCGSVMGQLRGLVTWADSPGNVKYRRVITARNNDNAVLNNYPVMVSINSASLAGQNKLRSDGGDLRITNEGSDVNLPLGNSTPFMESQTTVWFKAGLMPNEEKKFYMYYGNPTASYTPASMTSVTGLDYGRGVFLLCHFDGTTACEGNMVSKNSEGVEFKNDARSIEGETIGVTGIYINETDRLSYASSENFNKNRGTIMMWFKPVDTAGERYLFYSKDISGNPQFSVHFNAGGIFFELWNKAGNNYVLNGGALTPGWHHLAVTWDNLKGAGIYVDGALSDSKSVTWEANDVGLDVYIGTNGSAAAYSLIDELAVYSQELDQVSVKEKMRYYRPIVTVGPEETISDTVTTSEAGVYEKCDAMLRNVSSSDGGRRATIISLCDSIRICNKTDFPINAISECSFGSQACAGGRWGNCTAVMPKTETCNGKDDDCNGIIDDVAVPSTCACYNGTHTPGELRELCNGVDDDCSGKIDDVNGGNSANSTHCGCFNQIVNITQRMAVRETSCNGVDDNCNGLVDEGIDNCACRGTVFAPNNDTLTQAMSAEKCNSIDDDCNNVIDDPWRQGGSGAGASRYLGAQCGYLNSRCSGGMYVCSNNENGLICNTMSTEGAGGHDLRINETCNGIDDDCNNVIDDVMGSDSGRFCHCYNGVPKTNETCNGKDDDCNGLADDGLNNCGCSFGMAVNTSNMNQLSLVIDLKKLAGEVCNNIDDNCNGQADEGIGDACFCSGGFSGNPAMRPEFCNGVDDDCNGVVDNIAHPETCACFNETHAHGELNESCNGVDDNCNGLVDENWPNLGGTCGLGACIGGVYECSGDGKGTVCSTGPGGSKDKSKPEVCGDGIDNNCNGVIDEGCACEAIGVGVTRNCSTNVGECRVGVQTCTTSGWSGCIGGVMSKADVCNGKDDDCDGIIDNVPNPSVCACSNGAHNAGDLQEACNGVDDDCSGIVDDLGGGNSVQSAKCGCFNNTYARGAGTEACNNVDDDCNGVIDDVKGGNSVTSTKCGCYGGIPPGTELCNGIDDNCNGRIDESWPNVSQMCGTGICTGVLVCSPDGRTAQCNGAPPQTEICDGKDNDCDGAIDEGCFGSKVSSCENGIQDGDEEGTDCGGSCPTACTKPPPVIPAGSWMLVFAVLIVVIIIVGILLLFLKPSSQQV
jgi:hypothetical protein